VDPRPVLDDVEKRKLLTLPGLELVGRVAELYLQIPEKEFLNKAWYTSCVVGRHVILRQIAYFLSIQKHVGLENNSP
jgi:hypothetical protein